MSERIKVACPNCYTLFEVESFTADTERRVQELAVLAAAREYVKMTENSRLNTPVFYYQLRDALAALDAPQEGK